MATLEEALVQAQALAVTLLFACLFLFICCSLLALLELPIHGVRNGLVGYGLSVVAAVVPAVVLARVSPGQDALFVATCILIAAAIAVGILVPWTRKTMSPATIAALAMVIMDPRNRMARDRVARDRRGPGL